MKTVFEAALELLQQGERGVLTVILNNEGSTPRDEGAKMLVRTDGSIFGTIGGGPMEYAVMRRSAEVLKTGRGEVMPFDLGGKDVQRSVSICGGKALVCLYPMDERDIPILEKVCSPEGRQKLLALQILRNVESGVIRLSCTDEKEPTADEVLYRELPEIKNTLYLIGGGHVCEATAKVAVVAGFDIVVVDDREEFANNVRFPGAKCVVCQEYDEIPTATVSEHDYILVATRGHKADRIGLRWALNTKACYVGMIGSRIKRDLVYEELMTEGVTRQQLDQVYCPVGLPIGGRTPGDIAISIMGEIIDVRAKRTGVGNVFRSNGGKR